VRHIPQISIGLPGIALAVSLCLSLIGCKIPNDNAHKSAGTQILPLFDPHAPSFACEMEATKVPPIDAQADAWFLKARELEGPETIEDDRDYKKIVQLTRDASERRHWKAMLNLASLYLERRDASHGVKDAVEMVEQAMRLGIPAAYDRMGTFFMNGTGVRRDATRAFAFWQKAAEMGNPQAMAFLGERLSAGTDGAIPGYWANIPIATKMLECALAQGFGQAALTLHYLYVIPRAANGDEVGERTAETRARAIRVLHNGVRFGCADCANKLQIEFGDPYDLSNMMAAQVDKARAVRYGLLGDELSFNPDGRFPNLDKVLPLPPADLPPWNGDRDTLLEAAMGVSLKRPPPPPTAASQYTDRRFLDAAFKLRPTGDKTVEQQAPMSGYWQPAAPEQAESMEHPMRAIVNQHWRQAWMTKAQAFPHPERDWLLAVPVVDVTWYLIDPACVEIG
jgi:hypothetical protein